MNISINVSSASRRSASRHSAAAASANFSEASAAAILIASSCDRDVTELTMQLRTQASVLKRAVLDEQSKSSGLRDQLTQKEPTLRRAEQEVDSSGFRNKQLEG
ncbi:hypothetical protein GQX74_010671 [Glossina fuscipes]|nr:hypothetical protein GQX74_010671 [Glossina fuscipes]